MGITALACASQAPYFKTRTKIHNLASPVVVFWGLILSGHSTGKRSAAEVPIDKGCPANCSKQEFSCHSPGRVAGEVSWQGGPGLPLMTKTTIAVGLYSEAMYRSSIGNLQQNLGLVAEGKCAQMWHRSKQAGLITWDARMHAAFAFGLA